MTPRETIRPVEIGDVDALGLITVSASFGTFLGRIPEENLDFGWTPEMSARGWRKTLSDGSLKPEEFFSVADVGGRVVGFVWAGAPTGRSDFERAVNGLYVLPTMQGRGIGRRLLAHVADRLTTAGVDSVLIGCVKENPSCGFYEHLGGVEVFRKLQHVDRYQTEEIFFGWDTLAALR